MAVSYWYWKQVLRSLVPVLGTSLKNRTWLSALLIALAAYGAATGIEISASIVVARSIQLSSSGELLVSVVAGLAATTLCGYVGTRIRRGTAALLAAITGLVVAALIVVDSGNVPLWYAILFLVAGPIASMGGGMLWVMWQNWSEARESGG